VSRPVTFRSRRVASPAGVGPACVEVSGDVVSGVRAYEDLSDGELRDLGDAVLMPGLVDSHVHVNEPGRTEWEGWETATRAAAAGGVTTICDMPLNSIPVATTPEAVDLKARAAARTACVDFALWGGLVPENAGKMDALLDAGVPGVKCFLVPSGIDEFPNVTEKDLLVAMPALARRGAVLLVHAELPGPIEAAGTAGDPRAYSTWLRSRPNAAEDEAIALVVRLAATTGCRVHIVHLSSASALPLLKNARSEGVPVTVETCPHYLTFTAEDVPDGRTEWKCAPPIRERANREALWEALRDGTIDMVVSDHSPCTPELKARGSGDFLAAWGGISSLQLLLPALFTEASRRGFGVEDVVRWSCERPAALAGLPSKGRLEPGRDADLVVWYPEKELAVNAAELRHRHKVTPYAGRVLSGSVAETYVRGELVYDARRPEPFGPPRGRRVEGA
jgi:allantoinase